MYFLLEKMKRMLQSKQSDQFDSLHLTHVVVVVSSFCFECFLLREKRKEVESEEKNIDGLQKKLKRM